MEEEGHAPVEVRSAADGTRRRPTPGTGWGMGVRLRERETAATAKLKEAAPFQGGPWGCASRPSCYLVRVFVFAKKF